MTGSYLLAIRRRASEYSAADHVVDSCRYLRWGRVRTLRHVRYLLLLLGPIEATLHNNPGNAPSSYGRHQREPVHRLGTLSVPTHTLPMTSRLPCSSWQQYSPQFRAPGNLVSIRTLFMPNSWIPPRLEQSLVPSLPNAAVPAPFPTTYPLRPRHRPFFPLPSDSLVAILDTPRVETHPSRPSYVPIAAFPERAA